MDWSTAEKVAHHGIVQRALAPFEQLLPPESRLPGPLELGAPGLIERYVAAAGFRDILVERHTFEHVYSSPEEYCRAHLRPALLDISNGLPELGPVEQDLIRQDVLSQLEGYRRGDRICLPSEAIYVTAFA
jgi:hypothetical protein